MLALEDARVRGAQLGRIIRGRRSRRVASPPVRAPLRSQRGDAATATAAAAAWRTRAAETPWTPQCECIVAHTRTPARDGGVPHACRVRVRVVCVFLCVCWCNTTGQETSVAGCRPVDGGHAKESESEDGKRDGRKPIEDCVRCDCRSAAAAARTHLPWCFTTHAFSQARARESDRVRAGGIQACVAMRTVDFALGTALTSSSHLTSFAHVLCTLV